MSPLPSARVLAAGLAIALACATGSPSTTGKAPAFGGSPDRRIFLVAAQQKDEIAASLRIAGFEVVGNLLDATFFLRATLGNEQGFRSCGTLQNVKYSLRNEGQEVLLIAKAGWTGLCQPNVFDVMSRDLLTAFEGGRGVPAVRAIEGSSP